MRTVFVSAQAANRVYDFVNGPVEELQANQSESITKTRLFKYIKNFTTKNENFQMKNSDIFHISAQNINCGYSLARRF